MSSLVVPSCKACNHQGGNNNPCKGALNPCHGTKPGPLRNYPPCKINALIKAIDSRPINALEIFNYGKGNGHRRLSKTISDARIILRNLPREISKGIYHHPSLTSYIADIISEASAIAVSQDFNPQNPHVRITRNARNEIVISNYENPIRRSASKHLHPQAQTPTCQITPKVTPVRLISAYNLAEPYERGASPYFATRFEALPNNTRQPRLWDDCLATIPELSGTLFNFRSVLTKIRYPFHLTNRIKTVFDGATNIDFDRCCYYFRENNDKPAMFCLTRKGDTVHINCGPLVPAAP